MSVTEPGHAETLVAELTPPGRGAVGVVVAEGPDAVRAVESCFISGRGRPLGRAPLRRILVGHWGSPEGEELIVCRREPRRVEVHCHGGHAAVRQVIASLTRHGCREVTWQEWLRVASLSRPQPMQSQATLATFSNSAIASSAHIALADATTVRAAAILLDQLDGALARAIDQALAALAANEWARARELVGQLQGRSELGMHLTAPWRVVLAGAPNVGKSSLMNALAGYSRAIVSPTPGTTRDLVSLTTALEGWAIELIDTAGLHGSGDPLEAAGIELARHAFATADLVLLVEEASSTSQPRQKETATEGAFGISSDSHEPTEFPLGAHLKSRRVLRVRNKIDLLPPAGRPTLAQGAATEVVLETSAATGTGIAELATAIWNALIPSPPPRGAAVPFTALQVESLALAAQAIERKQFEAAGEALQSMLAQ